MASQTAAHAKAPQQAADAIRQAELAFDQAQATYRSEMQARQQAGQREAVATQARERSEAYLARQKAEEERMLRQQQDDRARVEALAAEALRLKAIADQEQASRQAAEKAQAEFEASQALELEAALVVARIGEAQREEVAQLARLHAERLAYDKGRRVCPGSASSATGSRCRWHSLRLRHHRLWHSQRPCLTARRLFQ